MKQAKQQPWIDPAKARAYERRLQAAMRALELDRANCKHTVTVQRDFDATEQASGRVLDSLELRQCANTNCKRLVVA